MRVLLVSHNVFCKTSSMGKTLMSYFQNFQPEEIAQFYIHAEVPTDSSICHNYYRFTDQDAIRSLFSFRPRGTVFHKDDIQTDRVSSRIDSGITNTAYQLGRSRTALIYFLRNLLWKPARWNTKSFRKWVRDFDPDVIFFASGDYTFMYNVAMKISDLVKKPLVVACVDDYFLHNRNDTSPFGAAVHRQYMKVVHKTMDRSSLIFTICSSMQREYEALFHKPCHVLHTNAKSISLELDPQATQISYIGNLDFHRYLQLIQIGRTLKQLPGGQPPNMIDVYSTEQRPEILKEMTEDNGIRFHGAISADEVLNVMRRSMAVIHTESFEEEIQNQVRYSVSTKIAESLMYGPCILAYGPRGIASMDYLVENQAAFTITSEDELAPKLAMFLSDEALRLQILHSARSLAQQNHHADINSTKVRNQLNQICHSNWSNG